MMKYMVVAVLMALMASTAFGAGVRSVDATGEAVVVNRGVDFLAGFGICAGDVQVYVQQGQWGRTLTYSSASGGAETIGGIPASGTLRLVWVGEECQVWYAGICYAYLPSTPDGGDVAGWWLQQGALGGTAALLDWRVSADTGSWGTTWDDAADLSRFTVEGAAAVGGGVLSPATRPGTVSGRLRW